MATFAATFANDTAGAAPVGWSNQWGSTDSLLIVDDATALGGKLVRMPTASGRRFFSFDAVGQVTDFEILTRCRIGASNLGRFWMAGRGDSTVDCIQAGVYNGATSTIMARYVNGGGGLLSGASVYNPNLVPGEWFRQRVRVTGNQAMYRVWREDQTEPTGWNIGPLTDTVMPTAAGWIGIMVDAGGDTRDFDWFSVGTEGDTALVPTLSAPGLGAATLSGQPFSNRNELSWTAVTGATSYDLERDGAVYQQGITVTSYTDLQVGGTHKYRVRPVGP